ncbi:metallophosphatase [Salinimicrobium soli]
MSRLNSKVLLIIFILFNFPILSTLEAQENLDTKKEVSRTIFISGNTGLSPDTAVLDAIVRDSGDEMEPVLLLLGNIINEEGFLPENEGRERSKEFLRKDLLSPLEDFHGKIIFTPGKNEWTAQGPQALDDMESFLQEESNREFWPNDGCPLERESLGEDVTIISVDSQWFLENWDKYPEMNNKCDLDSREEFFAEFQDDLKDSQGKLIIVALHHPVMSNTRFSLFDRVIGITPQSFEHNKYKELRGRLETLASQFNDVIFVSGRDQNLQYIKNERNPQIISGSASSTRKARLGKNGKFAAAEKGYAKLLIFDDRSSEVQFYKVKNGNSILLHSEKIEREHPIFEEEDFRSVGEVKDSITASIYSSEETKKTDFYEWLWGKRYRNLYSLPIKAPILYLDSLSGNIRPIYEGGGQQSRSLRLKNDKKNEYVLRALRKDPLQYIQADLVKTSYIRDFADNTVAERYVLDFFTTAHPYAPFAVNGLSDAAGILHASPEIYYLPPQKALGIFNEEYAGALYLLEAHVGDENRDMKIFGEPDDILSSSDLFKELKGSKENFVDRDLFIRARLFDMLIGDWDRHQDQWRWAEFRENGKKRYEPIPRDRDHAFSRYDGPMLDLLKAAVPSLRKMQSYDSEIEDLKWFNWSGYPLDLRILTGSEWENWKEQANFLQQEITDAKIEQAFENLPKEVRGKEIEKIKNALKGRRENLENIARRYYDYLQEFQVVTGTNQNDEFKIERKAEGKTEISILQDDRETFRNTFDSAETGEVWIYGLDGEDTFTISGQGNDLLKLKVLGGEEKDTYNFINPKRAKLYDYKSAKNEILNPESRKWLVDSYDINHYDYLKRKYSVNTISPSADFVPDAGFTMGVKDVYTTYGLSNNPFSSQYSLAANYFFASNGFDLHASAEFANVFYNWNFRVQGLYTSPNYYMNYFGTGNETSYEKAEVTKKFNRVKLQKWQISPSLIWRNQAGASFELNAILESQEVSYEEESFLAEKFSPKNDIFDTQLYAGGEMHFNYLNKNNQAFPSLGSGLDLIAGYKQNIDSNGNQFGYIEPSFSVNYPLIPSGFAAIATKVGGEVILGNDYEFYHAATIGGNNSLRGYRNHRFNGQRSFYHSTDLRTALGLIRTKFIPIVVGVSAGFDYGRVWTDNETSHKWHNDYGGSVWISAALAMTANVGFYHGEDGNRLAFTLNFKY